MVRGCKRDGSRLFGTLLYFVSESLQLKNVRSSVQENGIVISTQNALDQIDQDYDEATEDFVKNDEAAEKFNF